MEAVRIYKIGKKKPESVATVIKCQNKALILLRGSTAPWMPDKWNLPGGNVDEGESIESAAKRECLEEAGISVGSLKLFRTGGDPTFNLYIFAAETNNFNVKLDFESSDFKWITKEEVNNYPFVPYGIKEAVTAVLST